MEREYKGRTFYPVVREDIIPYVYLRCDIFVYLPKNSRMVKIRDRDAFLDNRTLDSYVASGHKEFYILDPSKHIDAYEFKAEKQEPLNPKIPVKVLEVILEKFPELANEPVVMAHQIRVAKEAEVAKLAFAKDKEVPEDEHHFGASDDSDKTTTKVKGGPDDPEAEQAFSGDKDAPLEENRVMGGDEEDKTEQSFGNDKETPEGEIRFGASKENGDGSINVKGGAIESEAELTFGSSKIDPLDENRVKGGSDEENKTSQSFAKGLISPEDAIRFGASSAGNTSRNVRGSLNGLEAEQAFGHDKDDPLAENRFNASDKEALLEQRIKGDSAQTEEEIAFHLTNTADEKINEIAKVFAKAKENIELDEDIEGGWKIQSSDKASKQVSSDIKELEEKLAKFSPDGQEFVDELNEINSGEKASEKEKIWNLSPPEGSIPVEGMSKEDIAAAKFSHALSKRLGLLRRELNDANRVSPNTGFSQEQIIEQRKALKEEIEKLEITTVLLESLDDADMEIGDLPEKLVGKEKVDLLTYLEDSLATLSGGALLTKQDHQLLGKKIKAIKSNEFAVHAENIDRLSKQISEEQEAVKKGKKFTPDELEEFNRVTEKEVQTAQVNTNVTKTLSALRDSLSKLLEDKPKNKKEKLENEKKAIKLQESIRKLESINSSLEAGEELDQKLLAPFIRKLDPKFNLKKGEDPEEGMERIQKELKKLKETVVSAKMADAEAGNRLNAFIDGNFEKTTDDEESNDVDKIENIDRLTQQISGKQKKIRENGGAITDNEKAAIQRSIENEVQLTQTSTNITKEISQKRDALNHLLQEKPKNAAESKANREMAVRMQEEIRSLEKLNRNLNAGKEIDSEQLAPFVNEVSSVFRFQPGEDPDAGITRILGEISKIKADAVSAKAEGVKTEARLAPNEKNFTIARDKLEKSVKARLGNIENLSAKISDRQKQLQEEGKELSAEETVALNEAIEKEVRLSKAGNSISRALAKKREELQKTLQEKPKNAAENKANRAKAVKLQEEIRSLEKLNRAIEAGKSIDPELLAPFVTEVGETFKLQEGEDANKGMTRILGELNALKESVVSAETESSDASSQAQSEIEKSMGMQAKIDGAVQAKVDSIESLKVDVEKFKNVKEIDPNELWKLNETLGKKVSLAKAGVNISRKIKALGIELRALSDRVPKNDAEREEIELEKKRIIAEMQRLHAMDEAIDRGETIDEKSLEPFIEKIDQIFTFSPDKTPAENVTTVLAALETLKEEMISFKAEAIEENKEVLFSDTGSGIINEVTSLVKDNLAEQRAADEAFSKLVPDEENKQLQASVYAATLYRSFGYENKELEEDLMMATYLWNYSEEELKGAFSERVLALHHASHHNGESGEMALKELGQAVSMARGYLAAPGVVQGKFSVDYAIFSNYCEQLSDAPQGEVDFQLMERALQGVSSTLLKAERDDLMDHAKNISTRLGKWKMEKQKEKLTLISS